MQSLGSYGMKKAKRKAPAQAAESFRLSQHKKAGNVKGEDSKSNSNALHSLALLSR